MKSESFIGAGEELCAHAVSFASAGLNGVLHGSMLAVGFRAAGNKFVVGNPFVDTRNAAPGR